MAHSSPGNAPHARRGRTVTRLALIGIISLFAVLVALEVAFRMMPQAIPLGACKASPTLGQAYCQYFYAFDQPMRLGYTFRPGYRFEGPWNPADPAVIGAEDETCGSGPDATFHYVLQVDDHGFVNPTPWQDRYDIIVTGDSFTMPFTQVWWVDELAAQTGLSVLNLGVNGWGPLSEVEAVRMYGLDKQPQWVILLYFEGNDLFNAEEYQRRRESGLDWRSYQLSLVSPINRLVVPNVLRYWVQQAASLFRSEDPPVCRYPMTVSTNVNHFETVLFDVHIAQLSAWREEIEASQAWGLVTQAIRDLRDEVTAQGGRFLLVYVPAKEHLFFSRLWDERDIGHFLERTSPLCSYQEFSAHVDDQMLLMEAFAAAHDIELLNLTGPLWLESVNGAELYNYADVHWNDAGNRLTARLIADYIQTRAE